VVEDHLIVDGMAESYTREPWVWHGETIEDWVQAGGGLHEAPNVPLATDGEIESLLDDLYPGLSDMNGDPPNVNAPNPLPPDDVRSFNELLEEANKEIYPGCRVMKKMDFLVRVFQHK
jgi:hypothetical protein